MQVTFRAAKYEDLDIIYELETACFPKEIQISYEYYKTALKTYPEHFLLLYVEHKFVGLINALPTNERTIIDTMFEDASLYDKNGDNLALIGLMVLPEYQGKGYAQKLMRRFIRLAREERKKHLILTCRKELVGFYQKFGFEYKGISNSMLGGITWHELVLSVDSDDDYQ